MTENVPLTTSGRLTTFVIAVTLLACTVTAAVTYMNVRASEDGHAERLAAGTDAAAADIESYLTESRNLVSAIAREHQKLLTAYAGQPESAELRHEIGKALRGAFPDYFTFTIADRTGEDLIQDIEGFVGEACQANIREYVTHLADAGGSADYRTVIHPQANNYHFDVMAPWSDGDRLKGVFFVSLFPTRLQGILQTHQSPGHRLALINRERPYLIEVSAGGARDRISLRREINLTDDEIAAIAAKRDIPGSRWRLVGYTNPEHRARERTDAWVVAIIVIFLLIAGGGAAAWMLSTRTG